MNIYEKLLSISRDASAVAKNLTVGVGKSSYKAVGEADVLAAVKPLEAKYGVYSYPLSRRIITAEVYTAKNDYGEKSTQFVRLETVYRFVNIEKPDEYVEITTYGDGVDPQDKAPGKAMTYADKYALLKAYKLITGDDLDQYPSGDIGTPQPNGAPARDEHPARDRRTAGGDGGAGDEDRGRRGLLQEDARNAHGSGGCESDIAQARQEKEGGRKWQTG